MRPARPRNPREVPLRIPRRHRWNLTIPRARRLQEELRDLLRLEPGPREVRLVAGVDAAFLPDRGLCVAAAVVVELPGLAVVEERLARAPLRFPYVPGFLTFREGEAVLCALRTLACEPDVVVCDGQGIAHPRGFGLAAHLGVLLDRPTLGAAKSRLVGDAGTPGPRRGDEAPLLLDGRPVGVVLRTRARVKPIFVSPGHRMDLPSAAALALRLCGRYRVPEPVRQAHARVTAERKRLLATRRPAASRARPSRPR